MLPATVAKTTQLFLMEQFQGLKFHFKVTNKTFGNLKKKASQRTDSLATTEAHTYPHA